MNEANLFACWLYQERPSKLTRKDLEALPLDEIQHLPIHDLIAALYYGRDSQSMLALKQLRKNFEEEMNHLESLTYPQEMTCE